MSSSSVSYLFSEISDEALSALSELGFSDTGTRRLCLHASEEDLLHVMLVEIKPNTFFRYHSHTSDEFVFMLSGAIKVLEKEGPARCFSTDGLLGGIIPAGTLHAVESDKSGATYLEVIRGPFIKS